MPRTARPPGVSPALDVDLGYVRWRWWRGSPTNACSSKAMSRSEITKRAGSIGAASGGFLSRRRSQARNSSLSSRSAAFRPARNNRSRSDGSSCAQPAIVALYKSMRAGIRETLEKRSAKNKSPKTKIRNTLKARGRAVPPSVSHAQRTPALSAKAWRGRFRHCICS